MGTKDQLLMLFENNKGVFFSGEEIAEKLSISRTAVWKSVQSLRREGYHIEAVRNKGYCLSVETDILSVQGVQKYLEPICKNMELNVLGSVDSTNTFARERAVNGAPDGYTVIANTQTCGRGRRGRNFYSPADTGVYMSLVLRPHHYLAQQAVRLTTMAAVAVCEAIEAVSGEKAEIKWVNDIFVRGKKVCGILTEASFGMEDGFLEYAILGIGINVSVPVDGFPDEIKDIAGAVFEKSKNDGKNHLAAEFLNRFMNYYLSAEKMDYVENYRNRSMAIGKEIQVISASDTKKAIAVDIDQDCRLMVEYEDGRRECLSSGEISIKVEH